MKIIRLLAIIHKSDPKLELINFVALRDKAGIILAKDEGLEEIVALTLKDYLKLISK
jgi:hypothetical protein